MKKVSEELFREFIMNNLSPEKMREVEALLIEGGEAEAIIHTPIVYYLANKAYADELLGPDISTSNPEQQMKQDVQKVVTSINEKLLVAGVGAAGVRAATAALQRMVRYHAPGIAAAAAAPTSDRFSEEGTLFHKGTTTKDIAFMGKSTIIGEEALNIKDPIYILQPDDHSCALRCQHIILRDFGIDIPFEDLERYALENNIYSEKGTYMFDVGKVLEAAGVPVHATTGNTMQDLLNELSQGHRVIAGLDANELWFNETLADHFKNFFDDVFGLQGGNHALIVAGLEINPNNPKDINVVLTDPGDGNLRITYPASQFYDAWADSNFFMVATDDPAPYQYDPVTQREVPSSFYIEQHLNEWVQEHSYQLNPDMINIPDGYAPVYSAENATALFGAIGIEGPEASTETYLEGAAEGGGHAEIEIEPPTGSGDEQETGGFVPEDVTVTGLEEQGQEENESDPEESESDGSEEDNDVFNGDEHF